ncbi:MAG: kinase/pyrophosphorylase [Promicromonosporaceae bacterium]|nr:kinase/pyrophosphorylase [Promicromonosporaceae bacterium]
MTALERVVNIHVVADSTGDTGARVARAIAAQYPGLEVNVTRHQRIKTMDDLARALESVEEAPDDAVVFCTIVDPEFNAFTAARCAELEVPFADLMQPAIAAIGARTGLEPTRVVHPVGLAADYFERIHAMEFAIANDDGNLTDSLQEAKVVLVGASRTGKTPLSMYLGYLGYPTANVPLVTGVEPPAELFETEPWKIIGLTIDPERLQGIRERRVQLMGTGQYKDGRLGGYADLAKIYDELEEVARIQRRLRCPILDTTSLALEEAAGRVIELVTARRKAHGVPPLKPGPYLEGPNKQ